MLNRGHLRWGRSHQRSCADGCQSGSENSGIIGVEVQGDWGPGVGGGRICKLMNTNSTCVCIVYAKSYVYVYINIHTLCARAVKLFALCERCVHPALLRMQHIFPAVGVEAVEAHRVIGTSQGG